MLIFNFVSKFHYLLRHKEHHDAADDIDPAEECQKKCQAKCPGMVCAQDKETEKEIQHPTEIEKTWIALYRAPHLSCFFCAKHHPETSNKEKWSKNTCKPHYVVHMSSLWVKKVKLFSP